MTGERSYDIVLFGATGFTGGLTADYLAEHAPAGTRWALAGRSRRKLEDVRDRLAAINPACKDLPLLHADTTDPASLWAVAEATRIVATSVGPYAKHGEPLVSACASTGTDYIDLCGESKFVDEMYLRYQDEAVSNGARLVHACGFDSIPADLGVYFTVQHLPEGVPLHVEGFLRAKGDVSGGTLHSVLGMAADMPGSLRAERQRRAAEPQPSGRRIRQVRDPRPHTRIRDGWPLPAPVIDPMIVCRSAAALDRYGPDFSYGHFVAVKHIASAAGFAAGGVGLLALAQLPPARDLLLRVRPPGSGPSAEQRAKHWFSMKFVGEGDGKRVVTEVAGGDPGYGEAAKMFAESALCLAHDDLPPLSGQLTTATAMGNTLVSRLQRAGITFRVVQET